MRSIQGLSDDDTVDDIVVVVAVVVVVVVDNDDADAVVMTMGFLTGATATVVVAGNVDSAAQRSDRVIIGGFPRLKLGNLGATAVKAEAGGSCFAAFIIVAESEEEDLGSLFLFSFRLFSFTSTRGLRRRGR